MNNYYIKQEIELTYQGAPREAKYQYSIGDIIGLTITDIEADTNTVITGYVVESNPKSYKMIVNNIETKQRG